MFFEIVTCRTPWGNLSAMEAWRSCSRGERPRVRRAERDEAPPEFLKLMEACWAQDPIERPEIKAIVKRLKALLERSFEQQQGDEGASSGGGGGPNAAATRRTALPVVEEEGGGEGSIAAMRARLQRAEEEVARLRKELKDARNKA